MTNDLIVKFRPQTIEGIIGQKSTVKSLKKFFKDPVEDLPHAFIFSGPTGTGKTTISRIIAKHLKCTEANIIEVDAGTLTGVDTIRELQEGLSFGAFSASPIKFIIIDECHGLSAGAWKALHKVIEEPPKHVYWSLCTTESGKIPETIKSRCHEYTLKSVDKDDIQDLLELIATKEEFNIPEEVLQFIASKSNGSPRFALNYLSKCRNCEDVDEAAELINTVVDDDPKVIDLIRAITNSDWTKASAALKIVKELNAESVRIQIAAYYAICILNSKNDRDAAKFLGLLSKFSDPVVSQSGFSDLVMRVGDAILGE
jgi:DNA polymerase-3 subunit gamma/tau